MLETLPPAYVIFAAVQLLALIGWGMRVEIRIARLTDRTEGVKEMTKELVDMKVEIGKLGTTIETFRVDILMREKAAPNER